jgi:hypothetical protein
LLKEGISHLRKETWNINSKIPFKEGSQKTKRRTNSQKTSLTKILEPRTKMIRSKFPFKSLHLIKKSKKVIDSNIKDSP